MGGDFQITVFGFESSRIAELRVLIPEGSERVEQSPTFGVSFFFRVLESGTKIFRMLGLLGNTTPAVQPQCPWLLRPEQSLTSDMCWLSALSMANGHNACVLCQIREPYTVTLKPQPLLTTQQEHLKEVCRQTEPCKSPNLWAQNPNSCKTLSCPTRGCVSGLGLRISKLERP